MPATFVPIYFGHYCAVADLAVSELAAKIIDIEPEQIDRMLIAQALTLQAMVIGKDEGFDSYGVQRVW